jgi:hypothetical protein
MMVSNLPIDPARFVEAAAPLVDLTINEGYREGVVAAFAGIVVLAEVVMSFPLEPSLEPAPVFQP